MVILHTKAGGFLKTHDFLQPLEQAEKALRKEEAKVEVVAVEKPPAPVASPSVEHILPGGIGTYSISYLHQRIPKPEASLFAVAQATSTDRNDENSNCSSYTGGSGFTLWDESAVKKGKTGKENSGGDRHVLRGKSFILSSTCFASFLKTEICIHNQSLCKAYLLETEKLRAYIQQLFVI